MTDTQFRLLPGPRVRNIALFAGGLIVLLLWTLGVIETSDFNSAAWKTFGWLLVALCCGIIVNEVVGLRNSEIVVSKEGITAPHGLGWRPTTVRWEDVASVEIFRVPYGKGLSLRQTAGKTLRIGLSVVDDPDGLVEAVRRHTNLASS